MQDQHTIAIADDHPLFRSALFQSVHMAIGGAYLLEADSLNSLQQLLNQHADIDLLLLDLNMPGTQGMSGLLQLRSHYPQLPIVIISANDDPEIIQQAHRHGAFGFIPKSSDMPTLIQALQSVLQGQPTFPIEMVLTKSRNDLTDKLATLTPQQHKVLQMLSDGLLNKQIAYELSVSEATIKAHMTAIFRKLNVKNRTQAVITLQQLNSSAL